MKSLADGQVKLRSASPLECNTQTCVISSYHHRRDRLSPSRVPDEARQVLPAVLVPGNCAFRAPSPSLNLQRIPKQLGKVGSSPPCLNMPLQPQPLSASFASFVPQTYHAPFPCFPCAPPALGIVLPDSLLHPENSCLPFKAHSNILPPGSLSFQPLFITSATLNGDIPVLVSFSSTRLCLLSASMGLQGETGPQSAPSKYSLNAWVSGHTFFPFILQFQGELLS